MTDPSAPPPPARTDYPARLDVDYVEQHDRVKTLFRIFLVIPIAIVYGALTAGASQTSYDQAGETVSTISGGIVAGLFVATLLMTAGIGLFGAFSGFIASWFLRPGEEQQDDEIKLLRAEVAAIRTLLEEQRPRSSSAQPTD